MLRRLLACIQHLVSGAPAGVTKNYLGPLRIMPVGVVHTLGATRIGRSVQALIPVPPRPIPGQLPVVQTLYIVLTHLLFRM